MTSIEWQIYLQVIKNLSCSVDVLAACLQQAGKEIERLRANLKREREYATGELKLSKGMIQEAKEQGEQNADQ